MSTFVTIGLRVQAKGKRRIAGILHYLYTNKGHGKYLTQLADISSRSLKMKPVTVRLSLRVFSAPEFCAESDFEGIFDILTPLNHENSKKPIFLLFSVKRIIDSPPKSLSDSLQIFSQVAT